MAKKTRTELSTLAINTNLPDNTTELITPTTERAQLTDERESVVNYKDDLGGVPNAGKFITVATDGESLTMVDAPAGDVTGTGAQYQLAVWDGTSALTGYAALTYISSILKAPQLRADSSNGTVTINATDDAGGTAWLYFKNDDVLKAEISYFIQDDFLTIRTYQKDIVFERATNTPTLTIDGTTGDVGIGVMPTATVLLDLKELDAAADLIIGLTAGTGARAQIRSIAQVDNTSAELSFHTVTGSSTSEAMRISAGGDVKFSSSQGTTLQFDRIDATVIANELIGKLDFKSTDSSDTGVNASIKVIKEDLPVGTVPMAITFETGVSGTMAERLRISSGGNVRINNTDAGNYRLKIAFAGDGEEGIGLQSTYSGSGNMLRFLNSAGSTVGLVSTTNTTTNYATSSDYRLKENVTPITDALSRVNQLKPSRFNFISESDRTVDGFIAHEVQDIIPEAISGEKDAMKDEEFELTPMVDAVTDEEGNVITEAVEAVMETRSVPDYQGIDQSKIVPLLTAAIQEQQTIIDNLITRLEALEA